MSEQAKALVLAGALEKCDYGWVPSWLLNESSAELCRLHSVNAGLLEALQELLAAETAVFPPFEAGEEAQNAWAVRKREARFKAEAVISHALGQ